MSLWILHTCRRDPRNPIRVLILLGLVFSLGLVLSQEACADALGDGKDAFKKGDLEGALPYFQKAVKDDAARGEAWRYLGLTYEGLEEWEEALDAFDHNIALDDRASEAQRGRASALAHLDRKEEAVAAYRTSMELNRKFPAAALELGDLLISMERYDEAYEVFMLGTRWGKDTKPLFYEGLGRTEAARGNMKEAEVQILQAREMEPTNPRFHVALGNLYFQRDIPSLAIVSYQQAIDLDPGDVSARFAMAEALGKEARYNEALDQYKEVVTRDPKFARAYLEMGELYLLASDSNRAFLQEAITNLERYLELKPGSPEGAILLGRAYYKAKRGEEAKTLLDPVAAAGKLDPQGHAVYARILYENKQMEDAPVHFAEGEKYLEDTDFRRWAHALRQSGEFALADTVYLGRWVADSTGGEPLEKASRWIIESGKMHYQEGQNDSTEYDVAIARFQHKIELDPASDEAYYYMGLSLRQQQRIPEALDPLSKAAELMPDKADRHFWLAVTYNTLEQDSLAQAQFRETSALDDSTVIGAISRQQLGYFRLLEKDWNGAIIVLEEAAEISPKQVQTWVWLGQAYQNSGQTGNAMRAYRKALELDPNQGDAKKGVTQLSSSD
jgi:tetratricopeptide (TPR) repeat protein